MTLVLNNQITVGTDEVQGPDISVDGEIILKALSTNTGIVYVGYTPVTSGVGYPLSASNTVELDVSNLQTLSFIASAASQKLAWIRKEL